MFHKVDLNIVGCFVDILSDRSYCSHFSLTLSLGLYLFPHPYISTIHIHVCHNKSSDILSSSQMILVFSQCLLEEDLTALLVNLCCGAINFRSLQPASKSTLQSDKGIECILLLIANFRDSHRDNLQGITAVFVFPTENKICL